MSDSGQQPELTAGEIVALVVGFALVVVPSMPFVQSEAVLFERFHNWAIFVGGLLTGAVIARARVRLDP